MSVSKKKTDDGKVLSFFFSPTGSGFVPFDGKENQAETKRWSLDSESVSSYVSIHREHICEKEWSSVTSVLPGSTLTVSAGRWMKEPGTVVGSKLKDTMNVG